MIMPKGSSVMVNSQGGGLGRKVLGLTRINSVVLATENPIMRNGKSSADGQPLRGRAGPLIPTRRFGSLRSLHMREVLPHP